MTTYNFIGRYITDLGNDRDAIDYAKFTVEAASQSEAFKEARRQYPVGVKILWSKDKIELPSGASRWTWDEIEVHCRTIYHGAHLIEILSPDYPIGEPMIATVMYLPR